jgi:hypothetical protein
MVWAMFRLQMLKLDEPTYVAKPVNGWSDEGLKAIIDESRRELDDQKSSLDRILSRSQFLFSTVLALLAFFGTVASAIWPDKSVDWAVWATRILIVAAGCVLVLALLGSASLIASRKPFVRISAVVISSWDKYELEHLANEYSGALATGDMTVNAHLSVYGSAVRLTLLGALLAGVGWVVALVF